jgi:signal transduction histidine kinase
LEVIKKRKVSHLVLLILLIILQFLVIVFWYLETQSDTKFKAINDKQTSYRNGMHYLNKSQKSLNEAQSHYKDYLILHNKEALSNYYISINQFKKYLDSLNDLQVKNQINNNKKEEISSLSTTLDSIINSQSIMMNKSLDNLNFKAFDYNVILKSIRVDSLVSKDTIAKKGFFSRVMSAVKGKTDVKKEKLKVVISYKYLNELKSGEVKNQIEKLLKESNDYYKKQIEKSRATFLISDEANLSLFNLNTDLVDSSYKLIDSTNDSLNHFQDTNLAKATDIHKDYVKKRNYIIVFLILLMMLFTALLFYLTRITFEYEKRLVLAQENILKSLNFKNRIVSMISHEVRSPLSILSIYCKNISSKIQDLEIQDIFKSMQYTTNTLLVLTNQILEYSRNEDKKIELKNANFNLKTELDKIIVPLSTLAESKGNKLMVNGKIDDAIEINSDAVRISQLFYNIVGNAVKFTENGVITIDVSTENKTKENIVLSATVTDTGKGISESDLKNVFEDYYQSDASKSLSGMGVGLGLKLCKEIVELFKGSIDINSVPNKGTEVSFRIQLQLSKK